MKQAELHDRKVWNQEREKTKTIILKSLRLYLLQRGQCLKPSDSKDDRHPEQGQKS